MKILPAPTVTVYVRHGSSCSLGYKVLSNVLYPSSVPSHASSHECQPQAPCGVRVQIML
jgi:hypothetical protein